MTKTFMVQVGNIRSKLKVSGVEWNKAGCKKNLPSEFEFPLKRHMIRLLNLTGWDNAFVIDFINQISPCDCESVAHCELVKSKTPITELPLWYANNERARTVSQFKELCNL